MVDWVFAPPSNTTTLINMLTYFNNLTDVGQGGMFFTVMLIVFGSILFLMMRAWGTEKAFGITSIIVCLNVFLFRLLSWVNDATLTVTVILMLLGIFLLAQNKGEV